MHQVSDLRRKERVIVFYSVKNTRVFTIAFFSFNFYIVPKHCMYEMSHKNYPCPSLAFRRGVIYTKDDDNFFGE